MKLHLIYFLAFLAIAFAQLRVVNLLNVGISGGENATRGEFPYQISYQHSDSGSGNWSHLCGGSILTEEWILTAGHCVGLVPDTGKFRIVAGIVNLSDTDGQAIEVVEKIVHSNWTGFLSQYDLALLRLKTPLKLNKNVQKISLPEPDSNPIGEAIITGWGIIFHFIFIDITPNTLQKSKLPLIGAKECDEAIDKFRGEYDFPFDGDTQICTGPLTGGHGICGGDSGSPLVQDGKVIGVVSWTTSLSCGAVGAPSVYTKVSAFYHWIQSYIH